MLSVTCEGVSERDGREELAHVDLTAEEVLDAVLGVFEWDPSEGRSEIERKEMAEAYMQRRLKNGSPLRRSANPVSEVVCKLEEATHSLGGAK